jgi:hypothetical protein
MPLFRVSCTIDFAVGKGAVAVEEFRGWVIFETSGFFAGRFNMPDLAPSFCCGFI